MREHQAVRLVMQLLDRPIVIHRPLIELCGSINAAAMLSQALYWMQRTDDESGWFWKTQAQWTEELGLSRAEQESARKKLVERQLLMESKRGVPAKLFFKVNLSALETDLLAQGCDFPASKDVARKTGKQERAKVARKDATFQHPNNKETENTAENTADIVEHTGFEVATEVMPTWAADWPILHVADGDYEIKEPYASSADIRDGMIEWIKGRLENKMLQRKKKCMPTVFSMGRNSCGWWDKYPLEAVIHAVNQAAGERWQGIIEDVARNYKPEPGSGSSLTKTVLHRVQNMADTMEKRQAMIRQANERMNGKASSIGTSALTAGNHNE